jgi:hypothetical protein
MAFVKALDSLNVAIAGIGPALIALVYSFVSGIAELIWLLSMGEVVRFVVRLVNMLASP